MYKIFLWQPEYNEYIDICAAADSHFRMSYSLVPRSPKIAMADLLLSSPSVLMVLAILVAMGSVSTVLGLLMRVRLRSIKRLPRDLAATVFDKTFNVFDPYSERKKIIGASSMFPVIIILSSLAFGGFVATRMIATGMAAGFIVLVICLSVMMFDEASEINKNAKMLVNAVSDGKALGEGDMQTLLLVRRTTARLSKYYFSFSCILLSCALALPFIAPFAGLAFTQSLKVMLQISVSGGFLTIFLGIMLYSALVAGILTLTRVMKNRFFAVSSEQREAKREKLNRSFL